MRVYKQIARWGDEGVTVTFVHRETGERRTVVEPGPRRPALRRACSQFDPAEWRADVVSTPQTIYDDLTHGRKLFYPVDGERGREYSSHHRLTIAFSAGGVIHPETSTLGGAGCSDWL